MISAPTAAIQRPPARPGEHTEAALADWGFAPAEIKELRQAGALAASSSGEA